MRRLLFRDAATGFGTVSLLAVVLIVTAGSLLSPYDATSIDVGQALLPPSLAHPFGTDELGRDLFTRFAEGGVTSITLALAVVALSGFAGWIIGGFAGYLGRWIDTVVMRASDALQAFPGILLAMLIAYALGRGTVPIVVALSVAYVPYFVKIARGVAQSHRATNVVRAAQAAGAGSVRIVRVHVLPHILPPLLTQMTMAVGAALLAIAGLSIIGLGAPPPAPEWGALLASSTPHVFQAWWYTVIPGAFITLTSAGFNLLGDSVRTEFVGDDRVLGTRPTLAGLLTGVRGRRADRASA